jgi:tRNA A37 threonylcarbamoyladenosine dehydratase
MDSDLDHMITNNTHCIIGCGGIGYWAGLLLAMMGAKHIVLIDGDRIEASNLNRLPAPVRYAGKHKANALKAQIRMLRPSIRITIIPAHLTDDTFPVLEDVMNYATSVVWDCTDDARIQQKIFTWCHGHALRYCKLGYEGWKIGMYRSMNMWIPDSYRPGYTTTKANALSSIVCAAMGIMYFCRGNREDVEIDLKQLVGGA